jgi:hypothetical protein
VGLERGPLSPVSTIEELLDRKSSGSGLETLEFLLAICFPYLHLFPYVKTGNEIMSLSFTWYTVLNSGAIYVRTRNYCGVRST